jgi:cysteine desulfurase
MQIYLDNAATTKPFDDVAAVVKIYMDNGWHNPSALYKPAAEAHARLAEDRRVILEALHAQSGEVVFTSGGTEANLLAINARSRHKKHIITTKMEHPSVIAAIKALESKGYEADYITPGADYTIDPEDVAAAVREDTSLVSVMHVNNETGAANDIAAIAAAVKKKNPRVIFHSDGVQAFMKLSFVPGNTAVDLYSVSAHKLHALKGAGALYATDKKLIKPLFLGGGQESGYRSGTENTLGIAAFAIAVDAFMRHSEEYTGQMKALRSRLKAGLQCMEDTLINSAPDEKSAPHIINVSFLGVRAEVLLHALEAEGIYIGIGSACSSKKNTGSPILKAMGFQQERLTGAVRLSVSPMNTEKEIDIALQMLKEKTAELRKYQRR